MTSWGSLDGVRDRATIVSFRVAASLRIVSLLHLVRYAYDSHGDRSFNPTSDS